MTDTLTIAGTALGSRIFVGSARYPNQQVMLDALAAAGPAMVTMSVRRISLEGYAESLVDLLGGRYPILPNTSGCVTARDAILTAELAREALDTNWVKLELIGDRDLLYPDVEQLVHAADELVRKGFVVLPYCNEDPVACQKLADVGCAAVMPLGSLIGSGRGIANPAAIELICRAQPGAGRARCRHRYRVRRGAGDGARLRGGHGRHRDRQVARPGSHGRGNEGRGRSRPPRPSRRAHPQAHFRRAVEPATGAGRHVTPRAPLRPSTIFNCPSRRQTVDHGPTERLTTTPVITGPVTVFIRVKTFCSSVSGALAT